MMKIRLCIPICLLATVVYSGTPFKEDPLVTFSIYEPVPVPTNVKPCTIELTHHLFSNSFGSPAVVNYTPPTAPQCNGRPWEQIVMNFTATSNGTQFDRLALVYLNNVEVWRTSTPEPTSRGIVWTAFKDVTHYSPLFEKPGVILLDLGNLLDAGLGLTGEYDVTLSVAFYPSTPGSSKPRSADVILPLSLPQASSIQLGGAANVPPSLSNNLTFPRNAAQAFVEIYATGSGSEEFWYGNVPDEFFSQLPPWNAPDGQANPHGPFREVQLLIDNTLAGVVFPYPVIYSGEFLPSIWRPMLSYGAFDSPTYYIDITPFVPSLSDGKSHTFTLNVAGMGVNHTINDNWIVSGNVQIVLDASSSPTTGRITSYSATPFVNPSVVGHVSGPAPNVSVTTTASRQLTIEAEVKTGSGKVTVVKWSQNLEFTNSEIYQTTLLNVSLQMVSQMSSGVSTSTHNSVSVVSDTFNYPFSLLLSYFVLPSSPPDAVFYDYGVHLNHSYIRTLQSGQTGGGLQKVVDAVQECDGTQSSHQVNVTLRTGTTTERLSYSDSEGNTYFRDIGVSTYVNNTSGIGSVNNSTLDFDENGGNLAGSRGLKSF